MVISAMQHVRHGDDLRLVTLVKYDWQYVRDWLVCVTCLTSTFVTCFVRKCRAEDLPQAPTIEGVKTLAQLLGCGPGFPSIQQDWKDVDLMKPDVSVRSV